MQSLNKSKLIKDLETQYESGMQFRDKGWDAVQRQMAGSLR